MENFLQKPDFFLFAGQSNMAGRGEQSARFPQPPPKVLPQAGYEFRAISDPGKLHVMTEPFGVMENNPRGLCEENQRTGSLVSAFTNAYFRETGHPIIGLSASRGGTAIAQWHPESPFFKDMVKRLWKATLFFRTQSIEIRHKYLLWCQGESDGDRGTSQPDYITGTEDMLNALMDPNGFWNADGVIEHCFLIRIGCYNGTGTQDYRAIQNAQKHLEQVDPRITIVSDAFQGMKERGLMKDEFHYYQQAYNEVGEEAGKNTAAYVNAADWRENESYSALRVR